MIKFILILFIYINSFAFEKIFFLPDQGKIAEKTITNIYSHAYKEIDIAIYTFTNKKFEKALKLAAKRGVKVRIIADISANRRKKYSKIANLAKIKNIEVRWLKGKEHKRYDGIMHIKASIIDDRIVLCGSANYTKSAFYSNYEVICLRENDISFSRKFKKIFEQLWQKSSKY